jgi:hypothetical protein
MDSPLSISFEEVLHFKLFDWRLRFQPPIEKFYQSTSYAHRTKALLDEPAQATFLFTRNALLEVKPSGLVYGFGGEIEVFSRIPSRRPKFSGRIPNGLGLLHSLMCEGCALG